MSQNSWKKARRVLQNIFKNMSIITKSIKKVSLTNKSFINQLMKNILVCFGEAMKNK